MSILSRLYEGEQTNKLIRRGMYSMTIRHGDLCEYCRKIITCGSNGVVAVDASDLETHTDYSLLFLTPTVAIYCSETCAKEGEGI